MIIIEIFSKRYIMDCDIVRYMKISKNEHHCIAKYFCVLLKKFLECPHLDTLGLSLVHTYFATRCITNTKVKISLSYSGISAFQTESN